DGSSGINLHAWLDDEIPAAEAAAYPVLSDWAEVEAIKTTHFQAELATYFHYALFADRIKDSNGMEGYSGIASGLPGHTAIVSLGGNWATQTVVSDLYKQAGTLMHELGHTLGLHHGGHEIMSDGSLVSSQANNKPNYLSVMNYNYQMTPFRMNNVETFDYARFDIGALSESALNEELGLTPVGSSTREDLAQIDGIRFNYYYEDPKSVVGLASYLLDFNNDGSFDAQIPPIDLNGDNTSNEVFLGIANDWNNLQYWGLANTPQGVFGTSSEMCHTPKSQ
ncbi:MAG: hypothetical protein RL701_6937, partial [Pseudomonadota bacterium]